MPKWNKYKIFSVFAIVEPTRFVVPLEVLTKWGNTAGANGNLVGTSGLEPETLRTPCVHSTN